MDRASVISNQDLEFNENLITDKIKGILSVKFEEIFKKDSVQERQLDIIPTNIQILINQRIKVLNFMEESNNKESQKIKSEINKLSKSLELDNINIEQYEDSRKTLEGQMNQIKNILLLIGQDDKEDPGKIKYYSGKIKNTQDLLNELQINSEDEITPNFIIKNYTKCVNIMNNILKFKGTAPVQSVLNQEIIALRRILAKNTESKSIEQKILSDLNEGKKLKLEINEYVKFINLYNKHKEQNNKQSNDLKAKKEECNVLQSIKYLFFNSVREYIFFKKSAMEEIFHSIINNQKADNSSMHKEFLINKYKSKEGSEWINKIVESQMDRWIKEPKIDFHEYVSECKSVIDNYKDFIKDENLKNALSAIIQKIDNECNLNIDRLKKNNKILIDRQEKQEKQEQLQTNQTMLALQTTIDEDEIKKNKKYIQSLTVLVNASMNCSGEVQVVIQSLIDYCSDYSKLVDCIRNSNCILPNDLKEIIEGIINQDGYTIDSQNCIEEPILTKF